MTGRCQGCGTPLPSEDRRPGPRRKWCSERCRKSHYAFQACVDCGGPTSGGPANGYRAEPRCDPCRHRKEAERRARAERLWAEGKKAREIALEMGWTSKIPTVYIGRLRALGWNFPQRRHLTPEQRERQRRALERARATRRALV